MLNWLQEPDQRATDEEWRTIQQIVGKFGGQLAELLSNFVKAFLLLALHRIQDITVLDSSIACRPGAQCSGHVQFPSWERDCLDRSESLYLAGRASTTA